MMQRDIYPEGELSAEDRKVREEESLWCWISVLCMLCCPCTFGTSLNWAPCAFAFGARCCHTPGDKKLTIGVSACCLCSEVFFGLIYITFWLWILSVQWPICYHTSRVNCGFCYRSDVAQAPVLNEKRESKSMWSGHGHNRQFERGRGLDAPLFDDYYAWPYQTAEACAGGAGEIHPSTVMQASDIGGSSATAIPWTQESGYITTKIVGKSYTFNTFMYGEFFNDEKKDPAGDGYAETDDGLGLLYVTNTNTALDDSEGRREGKNNYEMYCPQKDGCLPGGCGIEENRFEDPDADEDGDDALKPSYCSNKCDCLGGEFVNLTGIFKLLFFLTWTVTLPIHCCLFGRMWKTIRIVSDSEEAFHRNQALRFAANSGPQTFSFILPGAGAPQTVGAGMVHGAPTTGAVGPAIVVTGTPAGK